MKCNHTYYINRCHEDRVPEIEKLCFENEICMTRAIQGVNTKVTSKLMGEIIEEFFRPISYKTMGFMALTIFGIIATCEILLRKTVNIKAIK